MEKRYKELCQALQHCKFQQCLRICETMEKKKIKEKGKKGQGNQQMFEKMHLITMTCLAATGQIHQASELLNQKFKQPPIDPQSIQLFLQICVWCSDKRLPKWVKMITDNKQKKDIDVGKYLLITHQFQALSRVFLTKYNKNQKFFQFGISYVYLQYLRRFDSQQPIKYQKNYTIKQNKQIALKFASLFLEKLTENFKNAEIPKQKVEVGYHNKIWKSIADLKFKIAVHEGNSSQVRKIFLQYEKELSSNIFVYLRSLKALQSQNQKNANEQIWLQHFLKLFRQNLNIDNYKPIYAYSIQFIDQFIKSHNIKVQQLAVPQIIANDQLYIHKQNPEQQIQNYINSLHSQFTQLKQSNSINKQFFKIAIKNVLLLLIYILNLSKKYDFVQKFMQQYKQYFGNKLTFPQQLSQYWNNSSIFTTQFKQQFKQIPSKISQTQDKLIWLINKQKLYATNPLTNTLQQNIKQWQRIHQLYQININNIQKLKKLQNGQRYLSDQFIIIQADSIRKFCQQASKDQLNDTQRQQLFYLITQKLQSAKLRSKDNYDFKLRLIYYYSKLNYSDQIFKVLESMDIKAVQCQTLGYFYLKHIINFCAWHQNDQTLIKINRSYQQNQKQSIQYAYKAVTYNSFTQCQQNLCYYEHISKSYNYLLMLFVFYMKNKGDQHAEFYLKQIIQKLKQNKNKITFNADFKIMNNVIDPKGYSFVDFYGIYNNYHILQNQCYIKLLFLSLNNKQISQQQINNMKNSIIQIDSIKQINNFSQYILFDKKIRYQFNGQYHHQKQLQVQLQISNLITKIKLCIYDFIANFKKQHTINPQQFQQITKLITQLTQLLSNLSWRQQVLFLPSTRYHISEMIPVIVDQISILSIKKNKIQNKTQKKQKLQQLIDTLIKSVSDQIQLKSKLNVDKKYLKFQFVQREDILQRVTKMNFNQFKKLYKLN